MTDAKTDKPNPTPVERVTAALEAAGDKGLTFAALGDEVNAPRGEKVPQEIYLAQGPMLSALAELSENIQITGEGDSATYAFKTIPAQTPDQIAETRLATSLELLSGNQFAFRDDAHQQALIRAGIARTAEGLGGAVKLEATPTVRDVALQLGLRTLIGPTVPHPELKEPREDVLGRRTSLIADLVKGEAFVSAAGEWSDDMRALFTSNACRVVEDPERGPHLVLGEGIADTIMELGVRALVDRSLPPPPPPAPPPPPPVTAYPEFMASQRRIKELEDAYQTEKRVGEAMKSELLLARPELKPRRRFTYRKTWVVNARNPLSRLVMRGRISEVEGYLEAVVEAAKSRAASASASAKALEKNFQEKFDALDSAKHSMIWDEEHQNCTCKLVGQKVHVFDEYDQLIADVPISEATDEMLTKAEREEKSPTEPNKTEPAQQATGPVAANESEALEPTASKDDAKKPSTKKKRKNTSGNKRQIDFTEPGSELEADGEQESDDEADDSDDEEDVPGESDVAASGAEREKIVYSVDGLRSALKAIAREGHVLIAHAKDSVEKHFGHPIPEAALPFLEQACNSLISDATFVVSDVSGEGAYVFRVPQDATKDGPEPAGGTSKAGEKSKASLPKIAAAKLRKVIAAAKAISGEAPDVVVKKQDLVEKTKLSEEEVAAAVEHIIAAGDLTPNGKRGRGAGFTWTAHVSSSKPALA